MSNAVNTVIIKVMSKIVINIRSNRTNNVIINSINVNSMIQPQTTDCRSSLSIKSVRLEGAHVAIV